MQPEEFFFPHDHVRPVQDRLILSIQQAVEEGKHLIVHAPTGLGKTAASISPALRYAIKKDKVIIFLTSRNTQHKIAVETLRAIKNKYDLRFTAVDLIGKKWFCLQPNLTRLRSSDFTEYCKKLREDGLCSFYLNIKEKTKIQEALSTAEINNPRTPEEIISISSHSQVCPYEVSIMLAKKAHAIIADYYYIFHPRIREGFLTKIDRGMNDIILIIDEAHNLPSRIKELTSEKLSTITISRALYEAKKLENDNLIKMLTRIGKILVELGSDLLDEKYISKKTFMDNIALLGDYEEITETLHEAAEAVRETQQHSSIGTIATFLEFWKGQDDGYTRIIDKKRTPKDPIITLRYQSLDPSLFTKGIIGQTHATILMSGTLTPTSMYKELFGIEKPNELTLESPFPEKNRLNLIIPKTTTKYQARSLEEYKKIGNIISGVVENIPGNCAVYFPSYKLRNEIAMHVVTKKPSFSEEEDLTKAEKDQLLEKFKSHSKKGAVLFAVINGNFSEGIDLPGDLLKAVIIVGLPLGRPNLETKALIDHFDKKYNKGWDYGYLFPAFTKTMQTAGRCIRSETDRGAIIFLDERYTWKNYYRCFPDSWKMKISEDYTKALKEFFS